MNLLERKKEFDAKVITYAMSVSDYTMPDTPEYYYNNYCKHLYKDEFKDITYNVERNYVSINFNNINPKNEQNIKNNRAIKLS